VQIAHNRKYINFLEDEEKMVAEPGIEPGTRGFSIIYTIKAAN
jgi:hypothetical protein